jgi:putative transposase
LVGRDIIVRKRFRAEQIIVKLREAEIFESKGLTQVEVAKRLDICEQTLICWRKEYDGFRVDQARRFKELEEGKYLVESIGSEFESR